ncbi:hypothetical protein [Halorarius halobius]|uniref:hypothetical protein n=1 Tax=Halorarius halobius TaxID=2962671 RepID=UPI0020CD6F7D|nr:hypothetical protein [Halorarius halobius]
MSWSRCSKALAVASLLLIAAVAPVAAVSTSADGVPSESQVGSEVSGTYEFTDLYSDYETWTLHGETNLTGVTWTVRKLDQAGNQISQNSYDGQSFNSSVDISENTAKVVVRVRGTTPEIANFTYDPAQQYTFARFQLLRTGGSNQQITDTSVDYYTNSSKMARQEIRAAADVVEASGSSQAETTLGNAISAYNGQNFELAVELANEAESQAQQAQQSQNTMQLLLYAGIGLVVLLLVVGGVYYYRSQQDDYDKLR